MDTRFAPHNAHLDGRDAFVQRDPHLRRLAAQPLAHRSALLAELPYDMPGIYTLGGGRQVGKTTLLKQWMLELLDQGVPPLAMAYLTGELIDDYHALVRLVTDWLDQPKSGTVRALVVDEVTYIDGWDRGIKYLADAGLLDDVMLMLTGSDLAVMRESRTALPGRRGRAERVDFRLHPLSFGETVLLKGGLSAPRTDELRAGEAPAPQEVERLFALFDEYLVHGGYLTAINDMAGDGAIHRATLETYSDWLRGDMLRSGKREHMLREVLGAVTRRLGSQITWNALAKDLSIDHPATVADYVARLQSMDALIVQQALREDRLDGAPKKARKVHFADVFMLHATRNWLSPAGDPHQESILPALQRPEYVALLVESVCVAHYARRYPTYYIKARGEVDVAYVRDGRFWPVEVKWTRQLRPRTLRQLAGYPNSLVLSRQRSAGETAGIPAFPLPVVLATL